MMKLLVAWVLLVGCQSDADKRIEKWKDYSEKVLESGVLDPAFEKFDRALAKADRNALQAITTDTIYDVALSDWELHTAPKAEAIDRLIGALERCGVAGKHERLYEITSYFGAVGLKKALFDSLDEKANSKRTNVREDVLPDDGFWLFIHPRTEVRAALVACGGETDMKVVVLAPQPTKEWRVIGVDYLRPQVAEQ